MERHPKRRKPRNESPELSASDFARAKRMRDVMPDVVEAMKRGRGRPPLPNAKVRVSLRLDPKIVAAYKETGEGWQTRMNDVLARAIPKRKLKRRSHAA